MVGRNVADAFHLIDHEPLVCIIIVEIGDPFIGLAAEFSQIMAGSRPGAQGQVDGNARFMEASGHGHGHMMDPGNMAQRLKGRSLPV